MIIAYQAQAEEEWTGQCKKKILKKEFFS